MTKIALLFLFLLHPFFSWALETGVKSGDANASNDGKVESTNKNDVLFQGTLLTLYSSNVDPNHFSVQPYFSFVHRYGVYDQHSDVIKTSSHQLATTLFLDVGLNEFLDMTLVLSCAQNERRNRRTFIMGDLGLFLGIELLRDDKKTWRPDVRFIVGETFPTGSFEDGDLFFLGTDSMGTGAFQTYFILTMGKNLYVIPRHPWSVNLNFYFIPSTNAKIHGRSIYGGGPGTVGIASPGLQYIGNFAFEQSLTKHIAVGLDMRYEHQNRTRFRMITSDTPLPGLPSSDRFSLAPCLECNFNRKFSLEGGCWFSVWGRNNYAFFSTILTAYYLF